METAEVLDELRRLGSPNIARILQRHGAPADTLGVRVGDLKPLAKALKGQHDVALALYDSGGSDAMYLAGLVADGARMSTAALDAWARRATWQMISEYTVPWVASDHPDAPSLADAWIADPDPRVASAGWALLSTLAGIRPDAQLPLDHLAALLDAMPEALPRAANRVRYTMNGFVIAVGSFVAPLHARALEVAARIGPVHVDAHGTACEVPDAVAALHKVASAGRVGRKRKAARC